MEDNTVNQIVLFLRFVKVGLRPGSWTSRLCILCHCQPIYKLEEDMGQKLGCLQRQDIIKHRRAPRQFVIYRSFMLSAMNIK